MSFTNTVTIAGNPTQTITASTAGSTPYAAFRMLCNRSTKNDAGEWVDAEPVGIMVKVFGKTATHLADEADTKTRLLVTGDLRTDTWTDAEGNHRTAVVLYADEVGISLRYR